MHAPSKPQHSGEDHWRRHILAQRASQLGISAYCRQHGLNGPRFFVWRKRLGLKAAAHTCPPVRTSPTASAAPPAFVAVELPATSAMPALTLHLPGERRLDIAEHCEASLLRTVLAALEGRPC